MLHLGKGDFSYWQPSGRSKEQAMQLGPHCSGSMELDPSRADHNTLPLTVGVLWVVNQALTLAHNDSLCVFLGS